MAEEETGPEIGTETSDVMDDVKVELQKEATRKAKIEYLDTGDIDNNPEYNARSYLGDLTELKASIARHGVQTPVTVKRHTRKDGYRLIAGFRRVACAKELGIEVIPCRVEPTKTTAQQMALLNLTENVQREELNPVDEARAYRALINAGMPLSEVAKAMGKSRNYIERRLGLLNLTDVVLEALGEGRIGVTAAVEIARLPEELHPRYVVIAEELATTKLRDRVTKELERMENRAQPTLDEDVAETDATESRTSDLRDSILDEFADLARRYDEDSLSSLHVLDLTDLDEPTLVLIKRLMERARSAHYPDEELQVAEIINFNPSEDEEDLEGEE